VRIALGLVLLYAAASSVAWLQRAAAAPGRLRQDEISAYELRFKELRATLPSQGVVGYIGSPDPAGTATGDANAAALLHFRRYLLAQYTLAPLVIVEDAASELVIGNFEPGVAPPPPAGLELIRDFGGGILLYRRSAP
jgi:hypothetical protein